MSIYSILENFSNLNLNKLTPEQGKEYKDKMDVLFYSNQLKPGDEGYQYDLQQDFSSIPKEASDWDD